MQFDLTHRISFTFRLFLVSELMYPRTSERFGPSDLNYVSFGVFVRDSDSLQTLWLKLENLFTLSSSVYSQIDPGSAK